MYRALIVEDEDIMRDYLAANLHTFCPEWSAAATAADGMEAVERLAHERFDAVITDIRMPAMDGIELSRYIRAQDAEMPILILSGYDAFDYARAAMRLNVFDYLLKPVHEPELAAALSAMAAQVAARRERDGGDQLALALAGDAAATHALATLLDGQASAIMLLAPALVADTTLDALWMAVAGLGVASTRLADAVAVCVRAQDALLLPTVCRRALERLAKQDAAMPVRCGSAPFQPADLPAAGVKATRLLQIALALDAPLLMEPLRMEHRQAAQKWDAMGMLLQQALRDQTLTEERLAVLGSALMEFPVEQRACAAIALLRESGYNSADLRTLADRMSGAAPDALPALWAASLRALQPSDPMPFMAEPSQLVRRARDCLQERFAQPISLSMLADMLAVTPAYLSAQFHREMGCSYSQYLLRLRMEDAARRLLEHPDAKVQAIASAVGFISAKHFAHVFREYYSMTPTEYRAQPPRRHA